MRYYSFLFAAVLFLISCSQTDSYQNLTDRASNEYLVPIRPGGVDGSPFWNGYAKRFVYAPAFDFSEVEGADRYFFKVFPEKGDSMVFCSDNPKASLSEIWNDIPVGNVSLRVEAADAEGETVGIAGEREFVRAYPFVAGEVHPARDYREAAVKASLYIHNMKAVQHWKTHTLPDMSYPYNAYVSKIIGATVRTECLVAELIPELREEALLIAKHAAEYMVSVSYGEDSALQGWPPTYGPAPEDEKSHPAKVARLNAGKAMVIEGSKAGEAFLDLYKATKEEKWLEKACAVAETFGRIQNQDGSWATRVDAMTGTQIGRTMVYPGHILRFLRRCVDEFGMTGFQQVIDKAEAYIRNVAMKDFDLTGQFEDSLYDTLEPYSNLTNFTGSPYADYLLTKKSPTEEDVADAMDLIRLSEDQFVHWDYPVNSYGFKDRVTPCVNEQFFFEVPVDASAADVCDGYLALYEYCSDPLALAKAEALLAALTHAQDAITGKIPTSLMYTGGHEQTAEDFWLNCSWWSIKALLRLDAIMKSDCR